MSWWRHETRVTAADKRRKASRENTRLAKGGAMLAPVTLADRKIARSFWGKAWCENLESYLDYANRLPRGRTYVRNGSVLDLRIEPGKIHARVCGSQLYSVQVTIKPLAKPHWERVRTQCAGEIGSLIELLQGKLSDRVMSIVTHRTEGLFPRPAEIEMTCSCPDIAKLCKHIAAALYGVGARLDAQPELLFTLREVAHAELIAQATRMDIAKGKTASKTIADETLADIFGIEIELPQAVTAKPLKTPRPPVKRRKKSALRRKKSR